LRALCRRQFLEPEAERHGVGGAEKHAVGKEIRTFPLMRRSLPGTHAGSKTGKMRHLAMQRSHKPPAPISSASARPGQHGLKVVLVKLVIVGPLAVIVVDVGLIIFVDVGSIKKGLAVAILEQQAGDARWLRRDLPSPGSDLTFFALRGVMRRRC